MVWKFFFVKIVDKIKLYYRQINIALGKCDKIT